MPRKAELTDADKQAVVRQYLAGAGIVALAREFRCRTAQINLIVRESGVPLRKMLTANTPIERRLHDALMAVGIGFGTQRRLVGRYIVDISLNQAPVVIEADGARHRVASHAQKKDAIRDAAHEAAGYRVFRFTGSEINADAAKCVQQVVAACGLVPDEEPVYDIRTSFSGADHPRWVGLYHLTCEYCGKVFLRRRAKFKFCSREHYYLAMVGRPKTPGHRAGIGAANRRRVVTAETRAKISAAKRGSKLSAATKAKISASLKARTQGALRPNQIMIESDLT